METQIVSQLDPNIIWAKKTMELQFCWWNYSANHQVTVNSNVYGIDNLETALMNLYESLPQKEHAPKDEYHPVLVLVNPDGEELICTDDDNKYTDWLKMMCVGVHIIKIQPEHPGA